MTAELLEPLTTARLDLLLDRAVAGAPLMLRVRRPGTLVRLLDRARSGPYMLDVVEAAESGAPAARLLAAGDTLDAGANDLERLVAAPAVRHALFVARAGAGEASGWSTAAGVWASLRAGDAGSGPALVVVGADLACPTGCQAFDDCDLFGPAEAALVARLVRPAGGLIAQAADAAAIEVARGDPALLGGLLELGDGERLDPRGWLARQPAPGTPDPLPWRGADSLCPVWLVQADPATLRRRVWRGHLAVLLPWLEELRADFLIRHAGRLPANRRDPLTGEAVAPEGHEWGHIVTALRTLRDPLAGDADILRRVRNALAHGDPAALEDCRRLESSARRLLAWR